MACGALQGPTCALCRQPSSQQKDRGLPCSKNSIPLHRAVLSPERCTMQGELSQRAVTSHNLGDTPTVTGTLHDLPRRVNSWPSSCLQPELGSNSHRSTKSSFKHASCFGYVRCTLLAVVGRQACGQARRAISPFSSLQSVVRWSDSTTSTAAACCCNQNDYCVALTTRGKRVQLSRAQVRQAVASQVHTWVQKHFFRASKDSEQHPF